jgi:hypothetical protein
MDTEATTVTMHADHGSTAHPAVDVKIRAVRADFSALLPIELGRFTEPGPDGVQGPEQVMTTDPAFTLDWIDANLSDAERETWWTETCSEEGFQQARELAEETFGSDVSVYSEGRSGGWLVVFGLPDPEEWDDEMRQKWAAFATQVRVIADDMPRAYLVNVYTNVFESYGDDAETDEPPATSYTFTPAELDYLARCVDLGRGDDTARQILAPDERDTLLRKLGGRRS